MPSFAPDSPLVSEVIPSPCHDLRPEGARPSAIVLHYIGPAHASVLYTAGTDLSAHYIVEEDGRIIQCVQEARRAWHAGRSVWTGKSDLNSHSIGIEIVNGGHSAGLPDYPEAQIGALIALCRDIIARHRISPDQVVAHSDVAPARKVDPGEKFPWRKLYEAGIGLWVSPHPIEPGAQLAPGASGEAVRQIQEELAAFGYGLAPSGIYDRDTELAVAAFQRRFRPALVDGIADASTIATLHDLLRKHAETVAYRFTERQAQA